jgi:hypothetical protein
MPWVEAHTHTHLIDRRRPERRVRSVPLHSIPFLLPLLLLVVVKITTTNKRSSFIDRRRTRRHHNLIFSSSLVLFFSFVQKLKDGVDLI